MLISKFDTTNVEGEIIKFEEKYNFKFPNQYRKFLLQYNGGITPDTEFRIRRVDIKYNRSGTRPTKFIVKYTIDGTSFTKNILNLRR